MISQNEGRKTPDADPEEPLKDFYESNIWAGEEPDWRGKTDEHTLEEDDEDEPADFDTVYQEMFGE